MDNDRDVSEALDPDAVEQEMVEENGECPECHVKPQDFPDGHTSWCKVGQTFQAVRDLRERLSEVEEDAARYANSNIQFNESYNRLRERLERAETNCARYHVDEQVYDELREKLEEAESKRDEMARRASEFQSWGTTCKEERDKARRQRDELVEAVWHTVKDLETEIGNRDLPKAALDWLRRLRNRLSEALDGSEGEDCTCGREPMGGGMVRNCDPDCPVHADEPEGDESRMYDKPMTQMSAPSRERAEEIADGMVEDGYEVVYVAEMRNEWADEHDRWCVFYDRELRRSVPTDEPVSGEGMTDVQKARCIAYREGFGDGYSYARETDPPDEGEDESVFCKCGHPTYMHVATGISDNGYEHGECQKCKSCREFRPADDQPGEDGVGENDE